MMLAESEEFYLALRKRVGRRFYEVIPQDAEDQIHDLYLTAEAALAEGSIREPEKIHAWVRTVARRYEANAVNRLVRERRHRVECSDQIPDHRLNPEEVLLDKERRHVALKFLAALTPRERGVLELFYLAGKSRTEICSRMGMTATQFRLMKSRAKSKLAERVQRRLKQAA